MRPTFPLLKALPPHCTIFTGGGEPASRMPYDEFPHSTVTACRSGSMSLATSVSNCPVAAVYGQKNWFMSKMFTRVWLVRTKSAISRSEQGRHNGTGLRAVISVIWQRPSIQYRHSKPERDSRHRLKRQLPRCLCSSR